MSIRKVPFVFGEFYHIFSRGNSKQAIFLDDKDRERFTQLFYLCNSKKIVNYRENIVRANISAWDFDRGDTIVAIGAWVLMPNHFHIYITLNISFYMDGFEFTFKQTTSSSVFCVEIF